MHSRRMNGSDAEMRRLARPYTVKHIIAAAAFGAVTFFTPAALAQDKPAAQCLIANMKDTPDATQGNAVMVGPCQVSSKGAVPPEQDFGWSGYEKTTTKKPREIFQFSTQGGKQCLGVDLMEPMNTDDGSNNGFGVSLFSACDGKRTQKWFEDKGMLKTKIKIKGKQQVFCLETNPGDNPGATTIADGGSFAIVVLKCTGKTNQLWSFAHVIEGL